MGVPKIRDTILGVPIVRALVGCPYSGKLLYFMDKIMHAAAYISPVGLTAGLQDTPGFGGFCP